MDFLAVDEWMFHDIRDEGRRDERAAVLRFLRQKRDGFRNAAGTLFDRSDINEYNRKANYLQWLTRKMAREEHLDGTNLEPDSSSAKGSIRREGKEGGPFPGA